MSHVTIQIHSSSSLSKIWLIWRLGYLEKLLTRCRNIGIYPGDTEEHY